MRCRIWRLSLPFTIAILSVSCITFAQTAPPYGENARVAPWAADALADLRSHMSIRNTGRAQRFDYIGGRTVRRFEAVRWLTDLARETPAGETRRSEDNAGRPVHSGDLALIPVSADKALRYYGDIKPDHVSNGNILRLTEMGLFRGYPDHCFRGFTSLTRGELATVACRLMLLAGVNIVAPGSEIAYTDVAGKEWWASAAHAATLCGVMTGYPDREFRGGQPATADECVVTLDRVVRLKQKIEPRSK